MLKIKFINGPQDGEKVIRTALEHIHRNKHAPLELQKADPKQFRVGVHHQIYDLNPADIIDGKGFEAATLSGSRYLVAEGSKSLAAAEITMDTASNKAAFHLINVGPFVEGFEKAVRLAESLPHKGEYACHILRIAPMYIMALWLKPTSGTKDIIVPLEPTPGYLQAREYTPATFLKAVLPHAHPVEMPV
ncbi:hypothetical protein SAMN05216598_3028 [Pseudomonas asplenii]|uniref:Uncharacterized protein n=1 Tax=Pseudomonas asplenii TaxID=53407 RepID=A0A1H1VMF7_9PSED|nr:hypothetical protein [Pseudomonas asplenii]SDS85903.1 hypothetical protein SAMN05216598_3028 [Pseudomonas asplenii]